MEFRFLLIFLFPLLAFSQEPSTNIDDNIHALLQKFGITQLPAAPNLDPKRVALGEKLFFDFELSGPRNFSCASCHNPTLASSDGFSLARGQDGIILPRRSPALFNAGNPLQTDYFWDGRVSLKHKSNGEIVLLSPEPGLNGTRPLFAAIADALDGPLALQALFPLVNKEEMRGTQGNEIADANSNFDAWYIFVERVKNKTSLYTLFQAAYPEIGKENWNIGHLGTAISTYIQSAFRVDDTPFDHYLAGNNQALTDLQKRGLQVFLTRGQCFSCHFGPYLSGFEYKSVGIPQLGSSENPQDLGRFAVSGLMRDKYAFKVPALRNIAKRAPYMHDGAFATLEEVINHYSDISTSFHDYTKSPNSYFIDQDESRNQERLRSVSIMGLRLGLNLSDEEKAALVEFLKNALTQP